MGKRGVVQRKRVFIVIIYVFMSTAVFAIFLSLVRRPVPLAVLVQRFDDIEKELSRAVCREDVVDLLLQSAQMTKALIDAGVLKKRDIIVFEPFFLETEMDECDRKAFVFASESSGLYDLILSLGEFREVTVEHAFTEHGLVVVVSVILVADKVFEEELIQQRVSGYLHDVWDIFAYQRSMQKQSVPFAPMFRSIDAY